MPTTETAGGRALNDIQVILGLLAGIAALIYVAGGATLGLRLLFSGIPTAFPSETCRATSCSRSEPPRSSSPHSSSA